MSFKIIEDIVAGFGVSEPVFVGKVDVRDGRNAYIEFDLKHEYDPKTKETEDPLEIYIAENRYCENFSANLGIFRVTTNAYDISRDIEKSMLYIYEEYSPLKNPKQSKIYKWLRGLNGYRYKSRNNAIDLLMIELFRYAATHATGHHPSSKIRFQFKDEKNNPHVKNIIAILEKAREKYDR